MSDRPNMLHFSALKNKDDEHILPTLEIPFIITMANPGHHTTPSVATKTITTLDIPRVYTSCQCAPQPFS